MYFKNYFKYLYIYKKNYYKNTHNINYYKRNFIMNTYNIVILNTYLRY